MSEPALQSGQQPGNALVAARVDTTTWYSGIGIAETVDMTVDGVRGGSWIDAGIGGAGTAAETAVWLLDPFGALVAAGFGFAVEHVKPLSEALDWLAGDPDQVDANARTWRNVSVELADVGDLYIRAVRQQAPDWEGPAAEAYLAQAGESGEILRALGGAADGVATIVAMAGSLVSLVRTLVRDLIGELVSVLVVRIPMWTLQTAGTFGLGTPFVEAQISALVAKWAARIARLLRGLITSLHNLAPALVTLDEVMSVLAALLRRRTGAGGAWRVIDERPGGAVAQLNDGSCVSAVGEMLSGRPQSELMREIGSPSWPEALAGELGPGWHGGQVGHNPGALEFLNLRVPWGATLKDGSAIDHMVVVDGLDANGQVLIRDPWGGGSTYRMDLAEFQRVWNGNAVYRQ